jgi:ubiquinone/menaquinone biosynthesis C-methylase UbiE
MGAAAGIAGAASSVFGSGAHAKIPAGKDVEPRGTTGLLERLPTADLESNEEFLQTFRIWTNDLARAAAKSADETLKAKGIDPNKEVTTEEAIALLKDNPKMLMRIHMWQHMQMLTWQNLQREFHSNYDAYMAEMEAVDKIGPGKLELNPDIVTPEFATHEIHMQPGGFTGDPFAGHMYYYLSNNFRQGGNNQDELHRRLASLVPVPKDGKVKRILDLGCGIGRMTMGLKVRFPDAEVWGVDIGAPLLRFAHLRGVDFDIDVNYRHALAEKTGFPDGYFDVVTSYILHHETPADSSRDILKEAHRILRPGGHYFPIDLNTGGQPVRKNAQGRFNDWVQLRWNHERWWLEYKYLDFAKAMTEAGFQVSEDAPEAFPGDKGNLIGYKNA